MDRKTRPSIKDFLPKPKDRKMLQVRVHARLLDAVQEQADKEDIKMQDLVQALFMLYLSEEKVPFEE